MLANNVRKNMATFHDTAELKTHVDCLAHSGTPENKFYWFRDVFYDQGERKFCWVSAVATGILWMHMNPWGTQKVG